MLYDGFLSLYIAMFIGTVAGLVLKYILDKKYIFFHTPKSKKDDGKKFFLYSLMGVFTTFIFWGFEMGFDALFIDENAKYVGAVIGLSIGYVVKNFLVKKIVFKD
jgi:putative flippase GtrA